MVTRAFATLVVFGALGACANLISPQRKLPGKLQVDLIFPKPNTTYTPTQWFPIVFGIQNVRNLWPLPVDFYVTIDDIATPTEERRPWHFSHSTLTQSNLEAAAEDAPGNMFFHIPTINMTNGTTSDYEVRWTVEFRNRCFENENRTQAEEELEKSLPEDHWEMDDIWTFGQGRHRISHRTRFSTSPDGIPPDIEASAGSCQDYGSKTTSAARIIEVNSVGEACPKFETNITGTTCNYRSIAKDLAANASSMLLGKMGCEEGDWRTIKTPCPKENKGTHVIVSGWVLLAALVFCIFSYNS